MVPWRRSRADVFVCPHCGEQHPSLLAHLIPYCSRPLCATCAHLLSRYAPPDPEFGEAIHCDLRRAGLV